jgi:lysophospholipase L1-like esterase
MRAGGPLLALASLALVALAAEGVLRFQHWREIEHMLEKSPERELCTEPDPQLVYRYAPGRCGYNSRGYRDDEHSPAKPEGVFRFVVLGDSVAAGDGVEVEERFDRVLAQRLSRPGLRVEPVNLARTGYSTSQQLWQLEHEVYAYDPDLVILFYVLNDPADPVFHNANGRLGRFFVRRDVHVWHGLKRLHFKLRERLGALGCPEEFHAQLQCVYAAEIADHFARVGELAKQHATPTLLVIHPIFEQERSFEDSSFLALHAELARLAADAGIAGLDLLPAYAEHEPNALRQQPEGWFDPWHPNARGHAVTAEAIEATLRAASWLPRGVARGSATAP